MPNQAKSVEEKQPVKVKISDVLSMLENGKDRRQIAKHYGLTLADTKRIFEHPKLKGKRVRPTVGVELEDDVPEIEAKAPKAVAETSEIASEATSQAVPTGSAQSADAIQPTPTQAEQASDEVVVGSTPASTEQKGVW